MNNRRNGSGPGRHTPPGTHNGHRAHILQPKPQQPGAGPIRNSNALPEGEMLALSFEELTQCIATAQAFALSPQGHAGLISPNGTFMTPGPPGGPLNVEAAQALVDQIGMCANVAAMWVASQLESGDMIDISEDTNEGATDDDATGD